MRRTGRVVASGNHDHVTVLNRYCLVDRPVVGVDSLDREALRRMAVEAAEVEKGVELRRGLEERLMTIACHSVIRANRKLDREEIGALLTALDDVDFATQCPHGRPVIVEFSRAQLERLFKRA